ncbi:MAG TPA: class I SAM-dependent methyltransferase [Casimicrobiaceae bacterium]|nr:class I SAM-dependent methyltransferase [Casimicrobiaceae bacterium]
MVPASSPSATAYGALGQLYGDAWYDKQVADLLASARIYVAHLWRYVQPRTVLDVGCGRGPWLRAWHEQGSSTLLGFDGAWNSQAKMIDPAIRFTAVDLNRPFAVEAPVDLAMSLETAEHLEPAAGPTFVASLAQASDLVLFSAAFSWQGGTHHINEQPHSYWARLFAGHGLAPFDVLRPVFWGDARVCYWYRQNTFLYARRDSAAWQCLVAQGLAPLADPGVMDCVHPDLYRAKVEGQLPLSLHLKDLWPSFRRALRRRLADRR